MRVFFLTTIILSAASAARADVAVLMLESTGTGAARYTAAGHSAVYLSGVCRESPVKLRLCEPGEEGSVVSNYTRFGEAESFEWNVVPLTMFLYGVDQPKDIPIYGDPALRRELQERYRQKYLGDVCPATPCGTSPGNWRDMVGATFTRGIYAFRVKTTREQDQTLVDEFNAMPNVNRFNGFTRNCADFTRSLVNRYFPGSARADRLNDFGMTSPKAVAKSFAHYAKKHPELEYSVERYTQLTGPLPRSLDNREGTEVLFRAKKWSVPLLILHSHYLIVFAATYYLTGRFNPEHEYQTHRTAQDAALTGEAERQAWAAYKERFPSLLAEAVRDGVFARGKDVNGYFRLSGREGKAELDAAGEPVLEIDGARVGLTRETVLRPGSDTLIAERLMLACVNATLKAAPKNRESLTEFQEDWGILEELEKDRGTHSSVSAAAD